jgi:hypothetical protein
LSKARRKRDVNFGNDWLIIVLTKKNVANINAMLRGHQQTAQADEG